MTLVPDISKHPEILRTLSRRTPNTIAILESVHPLTRYTCAVHAFGFTKKPEYILIAETGPFAGRTFMHWLIDDELLTELPEKDSRQGDFVIYFDAAGGFKHIGLRQGIGRAVSKWGTGHLYDHGTFEVPEEYGSDVRFFKHITYETAFQYFRAFALRT